jgi:ComF family protein
MAVYEEPLRAAILKLKYENGWRLAPLLGAMAAVRLAPLICTSRPLLTFVPMHRRRRRLRGYDHAQKLAEGVARALGLTVVPLLERARPTRPQSSLDHEDRRSNVRGSFKPSGYGLSGEEVVIVDDVLTTGYTLCECAAILKANGAVRVTACVLARDLLGGGRALGR